jgi:hypothetical protein
LGHDLLDVLLLLVPEVILLLVVILVVVVVLIGVVILLLLGAVVDEVGGVTALKTASGVSSPLLLKLVHRLKFPCKQGNLVIRNDLVLLIGSCSKRR